MFKTHGLYALVVKLDLEGIYPGVAVERWDLIGRMASMHIADASNAGRDTGNPGGAPIVFADSDTAMQLQAAYGIKAKITSHQMFLGDYLDRRAQAQYAREHASSDVAVPAIDKRQQESASRYSDSNHPANSGNLISFVTGGVIKNPQRSTSPIGALTDGIRQVIDHAYYEKRGCVERDIFGPIGALVSSIRQVIDHASEEQPGGSQRRLRRRRGRGHGTGRGHSRERGHRYGHARGRGRGRNEDFGRWNTRDVNVREQADGNGCMMQQDILYLVTINLPSDAELAEAKTQLAKEISR